MQQLFNSSDAKKILKVFGSTKKSCFAYKDFLKQRKIGKVSRIKDIPITDKDNYFRRYDLMQKMHQEAKLSNFYMVCSSSGSTGQPTYWPRNFRKDKLAEEGHTRFLNDHFHVLSKKSLIVIVLDLGTTTAGLMHTRLSWDLTQKANATVITPGCRPDQAANMIENLYRYYDQVILLAYPTLVNEIIESALSHKYALNKWSLKVGYTGAGANELWRSELINKYGLKSSSIISFYGCTEVGFIGVESRAVNKLISLCLKNKALIKKLFSVNYLPTIVDDFAPKRYFEVVNGELTVTADQPIPLVRFNLHDEAKIIKLSDIKKTLKHEGVTIDLSESKNGNWLVIYGRRNNTNFSIEEVKQIIYSSNPDLFLKEFQYKEEQTKNMLIMNFILYIKRGVNLPLKKQRNIESRLARFFNKRCNCKVRINVKNESERLGYRSGKLIYFFD